jgi:hypothetical protein
VLLDGATTTAAIAASSTTVADGSDGSSGIAAEMEMKLLLPPGSSSSIANDDDDDDNEGDVEGRTSGDVGEDDDKDGSRRTVYAHIYRRTRVRWNDGDAPDIDVDRFASFIADMRPHDVVDDDDSDDAKFDGPTLTGIGMPRRRFATWVHYYLTHMTSDGEVGTSSSTLTTKSSFANESMTTIDAIVEADDTTREGRQRALGDILSHVATRELDWDEEYADDEEDEMVVDVEDEGEISTASPSRERRKQREAILRFWDEGKLLCEHTNLLSGVRRRRRRSLRRIDDGVGNNTRETRRQDVATNDDEGVGTPSAREEEAEEDRRYKLERLAGMLDSYAHRLASIVEEELSAIDDDGDDVPDDLQSESSPASRCYTSSSPSPASSANVSSVADTTVKTDPPKGSMSNSGLRRFIENEYGIENTRLLMARTLLQKSEIEQLKVRIVFASRRLVAGVNHFKQLIPTIAYLNHFHNISFPKSCNQTNRRLNHF